MLEWLVNDEIRISTILHLIARYWDLIGVVTLLVIALIFTAILTVESIKQIIFRERKSDIKFKVLATGKHLND